MHVYQSYNYLQFRMVGSQSEYSIVKSVYKVHSSDPENVAFMSTCPLYTG
jgi:hypothetical protein